MFKEHGLVKLKNDVPTRNLKAGTLGTVVMVYPESPQAYEVEFIDEGGDTLALFTVLEAEIASVSAGEQLQGEAA